MCDLNDDASIPICFLPSLGSRVFERAFTAWLGPSLTRDLACWDWGFMRIPILAVYEDLDSSITFLKDYQASAAFSEGSKTTRTRNMY